METRLHPSRLFVELTTRCNLNCGMCVRQNGEGGITEGDMTPETFEALTPAFPHLDALVLNGIGESLLHPELESFIIRARSLMPRHAWIGFQTNGMALSSQKADHLVRAGADRICISLDTVSADSFRMIRSGGNMGGIVSAFDGLNRARARYPESRLRTGIEFVLRRDNLPELPNAIRWAGRQGAAFVIVTQMLPYRRDLVSQAAYDTNTADAIAIYEHWKNRAKEDGMDIRRYLDVFMKSSKTPEEERIVGHVDRMRDEAHGRGIALNTERLLRRDEEWFDVVSSVFDDAERVSREEGMDLALPGVAPRNTRRCEFVEGGGSFVSWDGNVHPCYFLWHGYSCYVGGFEKRVKPWVFGSLRDQDIIGIWNSAGYLEFRERVLGYRFPFCFDCGFALCDYVAEAEFEQDCYIESVPCGACLWCTGLFQCLQ